MLYGYINVMKTRAGQRDSVLELLLSATGGLRSVGCRSYVVGRGQEENAIVVVEVWESREHHDASLHTTAALEAISAALPLLTGEFSTQEFEVCGGLGL